MKNSYKLILTSISAKDLESIYNYIASNLNSPQSAFNLNKKFFNALERICDMPNSCPVIENSFVKVDGVRKLIVDNYIILYVPNHDKKEIIVYRVVYGARNYINAIWFFLKDVFFNASFIFPVLDLFDGCFSRPLI